jgi:Uma2 family endonuclease
MQRPQRHYTLDEYFAIEEISPIRHEYFDGEIFAMSGASINHNHITRNLARECDTLRDRGCTTYTTDVGVASPSGLYTYPDVLVVCGRPELTDNSRQIVTNPIVLAEVLSKSTQEYDQRQKFEHYRLIATFRDYLLIDQYTINVEHRWLDEMVWKTDRYNTAGARFVLKGVPLTIHVAALYDGVTF